MKEIRQSKQKKKLLSSNKKAQRKQIQKLHEKLK